MNWKIYFGIGITAILTSCGGASTDDDSGETDSNDAEVQADVIEEYQLDAETCTVTWDRFLDQKATKKKVKIFGAWADVSLGPITLNMNGNVTPLRGGLSTKNGEPDQADLIFDMATFKFAEEQGQGLFDTKEYPESELRFVKFEPLQIDSTVNYMVYMELTIQDATEEIKAPMDVEMKGSAAMIKGDFVFNTLDFPLRDNAKKADVNTDEITVHLDLVYMKD